MGAAQSIPVVGETVTAIDSGVKLSAAGVCAVVGEILDDDEAREDAKKFVKDAGNTWAEYTERNVIVAPIRAGVTLAAGDKDEASRVFGKMVNSVEQVVDSTPGIGHAKGVVHYIAGDEEHGTKCMKGASRSLAVVGAGLATGGLGAGAAVGGLSGVLGGTAYDAALSVIEDKPSGVHQTVNESVKSLQSGDGHDFLTSVINVGYTMGGDFLTGVSAANTAEGIIAEQQKNALAKKVGKEATKDMIDAAKKLDAVTEDVTGNKHVCTKAKNLDTGEAQYGFNKRSRVQMRVNEFKKKGTASGYNSVTNAKKGHPNEFPRAPGVLENAAKQKNIKIEQKLNRAPNTCAEHHAINNLGTHGEEADLCTSTVQMNTNTGNYVALARCDNCKQYGRLMGDVVTDRVAGMPVPIKEFSCGDAAVGAVAAIGVACRCCGAKQSQKVKKHGEKHC